VWSKIAFHLGAIVKIKTSAAALVKRVSAAFKRPRLRRALRVLSCLVAGAALATLTINIIMVVGTRGYVYRDIGKIPGDPIPDDMAVMVLGSQIRGTSLSPVLRDRVIGGIALMEAGKGRKLLLSGDHGDRYYDEVNAMRLYVLANAPDIPEEAIFMDHAGFSTWDSMYRARDVFQVKEILIVTQDFHISRAVCIARSLGLNARGYAVSQDRFKGPTLRYWRTREYFARVKAFLYIIVKPKPKYLGEPIPIDGDGRATWI
jgi:SanA protein